MRDYYTRTEQVLLGLEKLVETHEEFVRPFEATQDGIREVIGISRGHVAVLLQRLEAKGLVIEALQHVKGHANQRKTYKLTYSGHSLAVELIAAEKLLKDGLVQDQSKESRITMLEMRVAYLERLVMAG